MTKIAGVGAYVPDRIYTNQGLKKICPDVNPEWTEEALNIKERRIYGIIPNLHEMGWAVEQMAYNAGARALEDAGVEDVTDVDMVIVGTTTAHERSPSVACFVSSMLHCHNAVSFDVSAACAGFGFALSVANSFIQNGTVRNALVIGADAYSRITDWTHRNCVFFGDGAGAVFLTKGDSIMSGVIGTDSRFGAAWFVRDGKWEMDGKAVFELAVGGICKAVDDALLPTGLTIDDVNILIPHQPGIRVLQEAARRMGLPFEKVHTVMDKYANTAAASVPIALDDALKAGKIEKNDIVVLATVGAGWTWSSTVLKWV